MSKIISGPMMKALIKFRDTGNLFDVSTSTLAALVNSGLITPSHRKDGHKITDIGRKVL